MEEGSAARRHSIYFVLITVFLDTVSFGIIIPVMPELIMELSGEGIDRAAIYGGWLMFVFALMQFFFAPVLGNLSDRFGRRPVLLASLFAFGVDYLIMGFAPTLTLLFVGRALSGIAGATMTTANAFIADITPADKRAQHFGMIGAAWGIGFIVGPAIGGLLGEVGPRMPFFGAAALAFANMVYGALVLPETLSKDDRRPFSLGRANPLGALVAMRRFPAILGMFAALVLFHLAHDANPAVWTYFTIEKFDWSERDIGFSLAFVGLMSAFSHGYLTAKIIPALGERRTVYFGMPLMAAGFLGFAFATEGWMLILAIVPFCVGSIASPAIRGIMSNAVPPDSQGELQGALASLVSLTAIVAPLVMTRLFGYFTTESAPVYFPGAAFFAAAVLLIGSAGIFAVVQRVVAGPTTSA